ncbi:MAG: hypothetical protein IPI73_12160 [Betaproteobacteria bacterium]|nr:hypothetical protein [Betaproteobacteria bacterium]
MIAERLLNFGFEAERPQPPGNVLAHAAMLGAADRVRRARDRLDIRHGAPGAEAVAGRGGVKRRGRQVAHHAQHGRQQREQQRECGQRGAAPLPRAPGWIRVSEAHGVGGGTGFRGPERQRPADQIRGALILRARRPWCSVLAESADSRR